MSFSFSVPAGPAETFADRASKAKADLEAASESNDYALTQVASDTADAAVKAAIELAQCLGVRGTASATISGHHSSDGIGQCSATVGVTYTPAPATDLVTDES